MYRKSFLFIVMVGIMAVLCCFTGRDAHGETLALDQVVKGLQGVYEKTTDLKANFVQEVILASVNRKEREEGTVYYKHPRKMLWDYRKPKVKKLIINPHRAYLYVPQDKAVYVQETGKIIKSQVLMRILSGLGKITEDFKLAFADVREPTDGEGNYVLVMIPKQDDLGVEKIMVTVHREDFTILQCRFADAYGNKTSVRFTKIQLNTQLPDKLFQFKPPPKTEVYPMT